jgi:hypothetical protein
MASSDMMELSIQHPPENAMKFARRFLDRFAASIIAVLGCFDRVIFKGYLRFQNDAQLNAWVDYGLRMRRKDFLPFLEQHSQTLVERAQTLAQQAGRPYEYHPGKFRKEAFIQELIRRDQLTDGLVAVLCVQEICRTVKLKQGRSLPRLVFARRPQRVLYYYSLDPEFGLMYVRLETWFPYTIQVYVNGHDWLARQMLKRRLGFTQRDNAFTALEDPQAAQRLADGFAHLGWVRQLTRWARQVNPLLCRGGWLSGQSYYWVTDQAEYATDLLFASRSGLRELFPRLLDYAVVNLTASDILGFLGRKLTGNFLGEVLTSCQKQRQPGARIKHRVKENWLKMYDKFGLILRVESVINQPAEFRVRRRRVRNGQQQLVWCPMNKGVANLPSYQRVARAANGRYLNALSVVDDPTAQYAQVAQLAESCRHHGRSSSGFNPARRDHVRLFQAVLSGDHHLRGFRNADIRQSLWPPTQDCRECRRRANAVTRLLKRLHVRGLVAKIPRTRRWRTTTKGQTLLGKIVQLHYHGLPAVI